MSLMSVTGDPRLPAGWRLPVIVMGAALLLAGLDMLGAVLAKEWAEHGHMIFVIGGIASFALLFLVYGRVLQIAELSVVTAGWLVVLQIGLVLLDRFRYGVEVHWSKWAAISLMLVLQLYLLLGSNQNGLKP
jgi:hypothetical protein